MPLFTARFSFEVQDIPAQDAREAASLALREVALRLEVREARADLFRVFLGRHEIGRVFVVREKDRG